MGLENTIVLLTGIFSASGQPGVITETFNLDQLRKLTCIKDKVTMHYFLAGSIAREDLARIVVKNTTHLSGRERYETQGDFTIIPALRFFREAEDKPFQCYDAKPNLTIGQRLVVVNLKEKILGRYIEPKRQYNNYGLEFLSAVEEFRPTSIRFSMRKKGEIELFVEDINGDYELFGCERIKADDYILVNRKNPNEIYLAQGVGFSRITNHLLRIDVVDSLGKRHTGLSKGSVEISKLYAQHTKIVRKAEANNGAN